MDAHTNKKIRDIIAPHFGYLKLYGKWVDNGTTVEEIEEFHNFVKSNRATIKKLKNPLIKYESLESVMKEINPLEQETDIVRTFKDGLNGNSRKIFTDIYDKHKSLFEELYNDPFKLKIFFRNSSKPQNEMEFLAHIRASIDFANDMKKVVNKIERNFDYLRTKNGAYLFKLNNNLLDLCPSTWCIHKSEQAFENEKSSRNLHSIWLLVDPYNDDDTRVVVGIDVNNDTDELLYMNTLNNRFTDNLPITSEEFFHITRSRLNRTKMVLDQELMDSILSEFLSTQVFEKVELESESLLAKALRGSRYDD